MNYLYISKSKNGWRNLAVDEYLLDHVQPDDAILYFYVNKNAVIIGRSQNPWSECNLKRMEEDGVQLVRRITGGGAVYHDEGNLNFSFIMGENRYRQTEQMNLILRAVQSFGIECEFSGRNDLLAGGRKFSGNAFCARRQARQHHGPLLVNADITKLQNYLNVDPRKLQSKGTKSVRSRVCNLCELNEDITAGKLRGAITERYREVFGDYRELAENDLNEAEIAPYEAKQESDAWRLGETPRFDMEIETRFDWGGIQMLFESKHAVIENLSVYTDANDATLAQTVKERCEGLPFDGRILAEALQKEGRKELNDIARYILTQEL